MQLSKTDFMQYLNCPKSLWLLKHEPEAFPHGEFSVFLQKLTREGYEVESYVRQYFQAEKDHAVDFQKIFETEDGLYARIDALEGTSDGKTILYEIKSSTSVKTDAAHNHIKDACFQKICAERAGQRIDRVLFRTAKIFLIRMGFNIVSRSDASDEGIAYCKSCMKARSRSLRFPLYSQAKQSRRHTSAHLWSEFVGYERLKRHGGRQSRVYFITVEEGENAVALHVDVGRLELVEDSDRGVGEIPIHLGCALIVLGRAELGRSFHIDKAGDDIRNLQPICGVLDRDLSSVRDFVLHRDLRALTEDRRFVVDDLLNSVRAQPFGHAFSKIAQDLR